MAVSRVTANLANRLFIPQLYSQKLQVKFYAGSVVPNIVNYEWEGEIRSVGDKINIRQLPDLIVAPWSVNDDINFQELEDGQIQLTIDYAYYAAYKMDYVDFHQMDINLKERLMDELNNRMRLQVENTVLGTAYASAYQQVDTTNNAAATTYFVMANNNATGWILRNDRLLTEQNVPLENRWFLLSPSMKEQAIQQAVLYNYATGDAAKAPVRTGLVGPMGNFSLYESTLLSGGSGATVATSINSMAGHRSAISFASQFTEFESDIVLQNTFGKGTRSLMVFGFGTTKKEALIYDKVAFAA
jgi:hypothetical protein